MVKNKMKKKKYRWTRFMDMHSGGGQKEKFAYCFIEAPEKEAKVIFYNRFGHNPERVTCTSIDEESDLQQGTAYERGCAFDNKTQKYVEKDKGYGRYLTLTEYLSKPDVCVIYAKDIKDEEREGTVPEEGYVWV